MEAHGRQIDPIRTSDSLTSRRCLPLLRAWIAGIVIVFLLAACAPSNREAARLRVACPPNPNMIPLFVEMEREDVPVTLVPVPGVPELAAAVQGGQADVALFFSATGAKLYNHGTLTNLRLWTISVWRAVYLVSGPGIDSLEDLVGKKILASFPGGATDLIMRAGMRDAGYDPDADFAIEYLPSAQVKQLLLAGKGDAALLPEPHVSSLIAKAAEQGLQLHAAVDLQSGFDASAWEKGNAPLGGIFVTQEVLDDPARKAAFERFVKAYAQSSQWTMAHPDQAGEIVAQSFSKNFGGTLSAEVVATAIQGGRLTFQDRSAAELRPDLDHFLQAVVGQAPDDGFYGSP